MGVLEAAESVAYEQEEAWGNESLEIEHGVESLHVFSALQEIETGADVDGEYGHGKFSSE